MCRSSDDLDQIEGLLRELLDAAASVTLPLFRCTLAVLNKGRDGGFDPVTPADRWAEAAMRGLLAERRPGERIEGEEGGAGDGPFDGISWILDPIDGTRSYVAGLPTWGTLAAAWHGDEPLAGALDFPALNERYVASVRGARRFSPSGEAGIRVRRCASLAEAYLCATEPQPVAGLTRRVRMARYSTDSYGFALLACGHVDVVADSGLSFHDVAAVIPLVEAAGGIVSDWEGGRNFRSGSLLAACNARVHDEALRALR